MLKKLEEDIWYIIGSLSETRRTDAEILAKRMLELVEDAGMQPPLLERQPLVNLSGEPSMYSVYEWEEE